MIRIACGVLLAGLLVVGCGSTSRPRISTVCPSSPDEMRDAMTVVAGSGGTVKFSGTPKVYAVAHGTKTEMEEGESEWCGAIADVFNVVTSGEPLTVRPGEEIKIPNPLPGERIQEASIRFVDTSTMVATPSASLLVWPFGPGGGSRDGVTIDENGVRFAAKPEPGRYVLGIYLAFDPQPDIFTPSRRSAHYALLVDVEE